MKTLPATLVVLVLAVIAGRPLSAVRAHAPLGGPTVAGIREEIPAADRMRYQAWKAELLSADTGAQDWQRYLRDTGLTITIRTSSDNRFGAGIGDYVWDAGGRLISATITLGSRIDQKYPEPAYYPVMHALAQGDLRYAIGPNTLAATKIAHEFGHLNRMTAMDAAVYRLRTELVPSYNAIIRRNGRNSRDPRLIDLARRMGGTPVELWEDAEYWGEANAMRYLRDRIDSTEVRCSLFSQVLRNVDTYATGYRSRFAQIAATDACALR